MLIIILMIQMRYVVLPIVGVLYLLWTIKALQDFNSEKDKVKGYTVFWTIITGLTGVVLVFWGLIELVPFIYNNW